jgi:hypothetical protein
MTVLTRARTWGGGKVVVAALAIVAAVGVIAVVAASGGSAAPKGGGPEPITLTFAGQVVEDEGLSDFTGPHPPIEGGTARVYTVPAGHRLVIESVYAELFERWPLGGTGRAGAAASVDTSYDLGECAYPGYQRTYGIPLTDPVVQTSEGTTERRRTGELAGPIYVEGGRKVNGSAFSPHGDSELFVHIVAHGYLEPSSSNPPIPVCGQP